jgi:hypothetical protein
MTAVGVSIELNGSVLASLFSDCIRSGGDCRGFFLGRTWTVAVPSSISDESDRPHRNSQIISVVGAQVWPDEWPDRAPEGAVGWFSFRLGAPLRPSMNEVSTHIALCASSSSSSSSSSSCPFFFAILSLPELISPSHTVELQHVFLAAAAPDHTAFREISVDTVNLSSGSREAYKEISGRATGAGSGGPVAVSNFLASTGAYPAHLAALEMGVLEFIKALEALALEVATDEAEAARLKALVDDKRKEKRDKDKDKEGPKNDALVPEDPLPPSTQKSQHEELVDSFEGFLDEIAKSCN